MKRFSFVLSLLLIQLSIGWGQNYTPASIDARHDYIIADPSTFSRQHFSQGSQRGEHTFPLDYVSAEFDYAQMNGTFFYFLFWPINNAFKAGPGADTLGTGTCKWAAVRFDTLYDYITYQGYPYPGTDILIDSIGINCNHKKLTDTTFSDTLIVSVLEREATGSGFTSNNNGVTVTNTLLWDTMIVTKTSLTPGIPSNNQTEIVLPCGYQVPTGTPFIIKLDYKGPNIDTFNLADYNRDDCLTPAGPPPGKFVNSSEAFIPANTWRYLNYYNSAVGNLSGLAPLVLGGPNVDTTCNQFYFQNWGITSYVTINVPLSASTSVSKSPICPGETVSISAVPVGGTGPYTVTWNPTTGLTSPFTAATNATVDATTTYTATITDSDTGTADITVDVTIVVNAITINAGTDQSIACDASANLVATPGGVYVPSTYKWSNGVVTLNNSVQEAGTYGITAMNSYGCTSTDEVVVSFPGVSQSLSFTTSAANNIGCVNQPITFNNTSSDKSAGWSWSWNFGDTNISTGESPTYTYAAAGEYQVSLSASTVSGGKTCNFAAVKDSVTINAACTGISNPSLNDKIEIYPNPTEGLFTVSFEDVDGNGVIGIYDIRGALIAEQLVSAASGSQKTFSLSNVAEGVYFVKIQLESAVAVKKLSLNR